MSFEQITTDVADHIMTITLNRPEKLNTWTLKMAEELRAAIDQADADDEVRVLVITGAGRAYCAGADLSSGEEALAFGASRNGPVPRDSGGEFTLRVFNCTKPVIGAINGPAVGIGSTMTLPFDIRLASETAKFGFVFTRRGIVPEAASSWFLPRVVGISQAMEWVTTGRVFNAHEALDGGLIRSIHPPAELLDAAYALAHEIADNTAAVSVALARRLMWRGLTESHPMEAHKADSIGMYARGFSADAKEGITSFLEKRAAVYPDKISDGLVDLFPGQSEPTYS